MQPGGGEPGILLNMSKPIVKPQYHNPSPLVWLTGHANEATVVVEWLEMMALVNSRS